jgi:hypothetical protein
MGIVGLHRLAGNALIDHEVATPRLNRVFEPLHRFLYRGQLRSGLSAIEMDAERRQPVGCFAGNTPYIFGSRHEVLPSAGTTARHKG